MKHIVILLAALLVLPSCATRPDGTKTFAGLDKGQWKTVGAEAGSAYFSATSPPSGKTATDVTPPAKKETSWLSVGLELLGL